MWMKILRIVINTPILAGDYCSDCDLGFILAYGYCMLLLIMDSSRKKVARDRGSKTKNRKSWLKNLEVWPNRKVVASVKPCKARFWDFQISAGSLPAQFRSVPFFFLPKLVSMWLKQCHKPAMTGNGNHTTYLW